MSSDTSGINHDKDRGTIPDMSVDITREFRIETDEIGWKPTSVEGLSEKHLWESPSGASICLLRFEKGAGIGWRHRHASNQFMFCLSGIYQYTEGDITLRPGDFYMNPVGSEHGPTEALEDAVLIEIYDGPHYLPGESVDERLAERKGH